MNKFFMAILLAVSISFTYQPNINVSGVIEKVSYNSISIHTEKVSQKEMEIWIPSNYDKKNLYNILILLHGKDGHPSDYMTTKLCSIYDNQSIVVVSIPANGEEAQIANDLRHEIIPLIMSKYSTWPYGKREHFGIGGASNGANIALKVGMGQCFDLFGNFIALSGNNCYDSIDKKKWEDFSTCSLFMGCGDKDLVNYQSKRTYELLKENKLIKDKNYWYENIPGEHNWEVWNIGIEKALQVLFKE